jgi:hypothetical protein
VDKSSSKETATMALQPPDFDHWFAAAGGMDGDGDHFTVELDAHSLELPSGRVVASEPGPPAAESFAQTVAPGRYPVVLLVVQYRSSDEPDADIVDERVGAVRLVIRDEPVVAWDPAILAGQSADDLADGEYFGYPVDGGTGCFADEENLERLYEDTEAVLDLSRDVADRPTSPTVLTASELADFDDEGEEDEDSPLLVAFTTGEGDGRYPTWIGRTADGDVACFVSDFFLLHDAQSIG